MKKIVLLFLCILYFSCKSKDDFQDTTNSNNGNNNNLATYNCPGTNYPDWKTSSYVLPYPVGKTYEIGLSHCSGSFHSFGEPDQFAIDFNIPIGDLITASRGGKVIYVEESGEDFNYPNNKVIVEHIDGTFGQYMHLTKNGAIVFIGQDISRGSPIGFGGATGSAGYPHLHFVITTSPGLEFPYTSKPITFANTTENPISLEQGKTYEALPY